MKSIAYLCLAILATGIAQTAQAAPPIAKLTIRDQAFEPDTITIPANRSVRILIKNEDSLPAEFESYDFNREKVIPGATELPVFVGPLKPGTYQFFNDFHPGSTGTLIVHPPAQ